MGANWGILPVYHLLTNVYLFKADPVI